jgi:RNA polymerase sigma factor (sigma-70 family)
MINTEPGHYRDELLVQRYRKGEKEALTMLIRRFHPKLIRIIRYQIHDNGPAEEIAQECWYQIIKRLPELELKISFTAWASCIARRKAIDWIREQQRHRNRIGKIRESNTLVTESTEPDDTGDILENLRTGINQLPSTQRIVLEMFYLDGMNLDKISEVLGVPKGTIKSRLFYARENLKLLIKAKGELP